MIILDTNVISEAMRPEPNPNVMAWISSHAGRTLYTTAINEAEILYGLAAMETGRRQSQLEAAALQIFEEDLAGRVLPFDHTAARAYAQLAAQRRKAGQPISQADALIAAIVNASGAQLATRNVDDFKNLDLDIIDPWQGA